MFRSVLRYSELYSKLIPIDEKPNDNIMHLNGLGKADRPTGESFNPCSQGQMFAFDLLRVTLARLDQRAHLNKKVRFHSA